MRKIVIILSVLAVFANSYGQVTEKQKTETMKIPEILNECWTEEGNSENNIVWYENGRFSFTEINPEKTYSPFGSGIYVYKPETREIFAQLTELNEMQATGSDTTKYSTPFNRYFFILEMTDSTVVVRIKSFEFKIDWFSEKGKYQLILPTQIIDEIPFATMYPAMKGINTVVHFAGVLFKARPEKFLPITNTLYFNNLLDVAIER